MGTRRAHAVGRILGAGLVVVMVTTVVGATPAAAAPPANDARASARDLGALPATVQGTTVESTLETDEPASSCTGALKGSVWYGFTSATARSVILAVDADGDMDVVVDVYERNRSQLTPVACQVSDRRGQATLDLDVRDEGSYVVRVAPLFNSVTSTFTLRAVEPDRPATPPGPRLPVGGVARSVDRFTNPDDAWSVTLVQGRTYRFNFVTKGDSCARMSVHRPGDGFGSSLVERSCDAHTVLAAPESGRYSIRVSAPRASREAMTYRLRVGLARADDTAPGLLLANDRAVRGRLAGSELDALDLYRFSVLQRSDLQLRLRARRAFEVTLLSAGGRRLGVGSTVDRRLGRGRYFVAVRALDGADGTYVLRRLTRTITTARTLVNGARSATVPRGGSVSLSVAVTPAVSGLAAMLVERFDPIDGWQFHARYRPAVLGGRATVRFVPPSVGRWRVTGAYLGTRIASPSAGGTATFLVAEPITG